MKKISLVLFVTILCCGKSYSQFAFGVSPGFSMNSAYFGYKINKVVPFVGFQHYSTSGVYEYKHEVFDYALGQFVDHNHKSTFKARVMMPNLGIKYFIKESGSLKAHLTLNICKPLISAKAYDDGDPIEEINNINKRLNLIGGELGFGVEYFFDDHFSIGGEFGLRYFRLKYNNVQNVQLYNPNDGSNYASENVYESKVKMNPTFTRISLNFYF